VRFLLDAQLPRSLCRALIFAGHEARHTLDLPDGNRTGDHVISDLADREGWIVMSKDSDFVVSHLLHQKPSRLLQIATGNITNPELQKLLISNLDGIQKAFETTTHIEITRTSLIIHG
jgi:predicted nuclease of predicted toxin-antitoxin system